MNKNSIKAIIMDYDYWENLLQEQWVLSSERVCNENFMMGWGLLSHDRVCSIMNPHTLWSPIGDRWIWNEWSQWNNQPTSVAESQPRKTKNEKTRGEYAPIFLIDTGTAVGEMQKKETKLGVSLQLQPKGMNFYCGFRKRHHK